MTLKRSGTFLVDIGIAQSKLFGICVFYMIFFELLIYRTFPSKSDREFVASNFLPSRACLCDFAQPSPASPRKADLSAHRHFVQ